MINYLIGALVATTMAVANPAQQPATGKATKPASTTATTPAAGAAAKSSRPIPEQPLKTKLENRNSAIPGYKKAKDNGQRGVQPKYTPRRTDSGARKDTMNKYKN
ncbi:hypothetical protein [Spirosoma rigui]|uniref:hypothetical protein n=1 Tax=Spirosoma rigui TaxID=564064 RepID=UPI0009B1634C|nr:hypothetical protein [Spirosoma rigui]